MTRPEFDALRRYLCSLAPLPETEWLALEPHLDVVSVPERTNFLTVGDAAKAIAFVVRGLVKISNVTRDGDEFIRFFSAEGNLTGPYPELLAGKEVSEVTITALEPTTFVTVPYQEVTNLYPRDAAWQQIGRLVAEGFLLARERRNWELLMLSAEARYRSFCQSFPHLVPRLSQKDLAVYIGVTPESLSRIRSSSKRHS